MRKQEHLAKEREKFEQAKEDELFGEWQKNFVYDFSLGAIRKRKKEKQLPKGGNKC